MDKNDLISRSATIEKFEKLKSEAETLLDALFLDGVMAVLDSIPSVDPEEMRPIGRWEYTSSACDSFCAVFRCSYCGAEDENGFCYNYCPNCGAYMQEDNNGKE